MVHRLMQNCTGECQVNEQFRALGNSARKKYRAASSKSDQVSQRRNSCPSFLGRQDDLRTISTADVSLEGQVYLRTVFANFLEEPANDEGS
jgi:hypothetical protein